jgi:hypothetical protein
MPRREFSRASRRDELARTLRAGIRGRGLGEFFSAWLIEEI